MPDPGASAVSDAMDQLGLPTGVPAGTSRVAGADRIVVGPARVGVVRDSDEPGIPGLAEFAGGASPGDVLVLAWEARGEGAVFGDVAATRALRAGAVGVVVDGWCRDIASVEAIGLVLHARGVTPLSGKGRLRVVRAPGAVTVGGVVVADGDVVVADRTGVCVVPAAASRRVLDLAAGLERDDALLRQAMVEGVGVAGPTQRSGEA
jgi:regulator of RNase E activity RraA